MIGPYKLPDNLLVAAAGNPAKDRAGTNHMPTHIRDRLMFLHVTPDVESTVAYFMSRQISPVICAYLRFKPDNLSRFDKDAQSCPSPRSWERVNTLLDTPMDEINLHACVSGTVGPGAALDFMAYRKLMEKMPNIDQIIQNPDTGPIPNDNAILFAVAASLSQRANRENVGKIMTYLKRLPRQEIAAFAVADMHHRDRALSQTQPVATWLGQAATKLRLID